MSFYLQIPRGDLVAITQADHQNGFAQVRGPFRILTVQFSNGLGWEHVSVSTPGRCPNWIEMVHVKNLFWGPDDVVMQLHPAERDYVNVHPHCLHLWRPTTDGITIPTPPRELVG